MRPTLDVTLDEATHIYTDTNQYRYDSVTTILNHYKEHFDPYKIMSDGGTLIGNYVIKHGKSEEYWLKEWDKAGDKGRTQGTAFHNIKEALTRNGAYIVSGERVHPVQDIDNLILKNPGVDFSKLPDGTYPEITIFNRRFMIAGKADKVTIENGFFDIDDYKTNGKYDTVSFKPPRGTYKMMQRPLNRFMDCHLYHHTIQLSTYAWMLEQFGLKCRQLRSLHYSILPEDEQKILNGEPVEHIEPTQYILNYEEEAVGNMIRHFTTMVRKKPLHRY